jgi:hypothetical protein
LVSELIHYEGIYGAHCLLREVSERDAGTG